MIHCKTVLNNFYVIFVETGCIELDIAVTCYNWVIVRESMLPDFNCPSRGFKMG